MEKLRIEQARVMVQLQADMNTVVNPDWLKAEYPFLRAVIVEAGEAMDHVGWKWWGRQARQLDQVRIELVDILHFYLSFTLVVFGGDHEKAVTSLLGASGGSDVIRFDGVDYSLPDQGLLELLDLLAGLAAASRMELAVLESCFVHCDFSWDDVFKVYVSKNVLNIFRQRNGYKDGSYKKIWDGEEDNIYLANIMGQLDPTLPSYSTDLYHSLTEKYRTLKAV